MKTLVIKNYAIESFMKVLAYPMNFQKGRVKNRFMTVLREKAKALNDSRLEILTELSEKDKDKKPIIENGNFKLTDEGMKKFNTEFAKMMTEDCIIDIAPSIEKDIPEIKTLLNNSPVELNDQETANCEEIFEALGNLTAKAPKAPKPAKADNK